MDPLLIHLFYSGSTHVSMQVAALPGLLLVRGFGTGGVCGGAGLNGQSAHPAPQQPRWLVFIGRP